MDSGGGILQVLMRREGMGGHPGALLKQREVSRTQRWRLMDVTVVEILQ